MKIEFENWKGRLQPQNKLHFRKMEHVNIDALYGMDQPGKFIFKLFVEYLAENWPREDIRKVKGAGGSYSLLFRFYKESSRELFAALHALMSSHKRVPFLNAMKCMNKEEDREDMVKQRKIILEATKQGFPGCRYRASIRQATGETKQSIYYFCGNKFDPERRDKMGKFCFFGIRRHRLFTRAFNMFAKRRDGLSITPLPYTELQKDVYSVIHLMLGKWLIFADEEDDLPDFRKKTPLRESATTTPPPPSQPIASSSTPPPPPPLPSLQPLAPPANKKRERTITISMKDGDDFKRQEERMKRARTRTTALVRNVARDPDVLNIVFNKVVFEASLLTFASRLYWDEHEESACEDMKKRLINSIKNM